MLALAGLRRQVILTGTAADGGAGDAVAGEAPSSRAATGIASRTAPSTAADTVFNR
jgi:hypothetical protein